MEATHYAGYSEAPLVLAFAGTGVQASKFSERSGLLRECQERAWSYYCPQAPGGVWRPGHLRYANDIRGAAKDRTQSAGPLLVVGHSSGANMASRMVTRLSGGAHGLAFYAGNWWGGGPMNRLFAHLWGKPQPEPIRMAACYNDGEGRWAKAQAEAAAMAYARTGVEVALIEGTGRHRWDPIATPYILDELTK